MGSPKALLEIRGKTFLRNIADTIETAGVSDIVLVLGADGELIRESLGWFRGTIAVNPLWEDGQLSSLIVGLNALNSRIVRGAMICPVDHPLITKPLLLELLSAFETSGKKIAVPAMDGRRGHPVIFDASLFDELRRAPKNAGARAVVHNHAEDLVAVPTSERGAFVDIDTMLEYHNEVHVRGVSSRHDP